jgi:hypothetical protein
MKSKKYRVTFTKKASDDFSLKAAASLQKGAKSVSWSHKGTISVITEATLRYGTREDYLLEIDNLKRSLGLQDFETKNKVKLI